MANTWHSIDFAYRCAYHWHLWTRVSTASASAVSLSTAQHNRKHRYRRRRPTSACALSDAIDIIDGSQVCLNSWLCGNAVRGQSWLTLDRWDKNNVRSHQNNKRFTRVEAHVIWLSAKSSSGLSVLNRDSSETTINQDVEGLGSAPEEVVRRDQQVRSSPEVISEDTPIETTIRFATQRE